MKYDLTNLPKEIELSEGFCGECILELNDESKEALKLKRLKLIINKVGGQELISNFNIKIFATKGTIRLNIGRNNIKVVFDKNSCGTYTFNLWEKANVYIGENTQAIGLTLVCENSEFICGKNCLFSGGVWVQSSDQHGIIDLASGEILNSSFSSVILENHIWIGRNVTLLSKAYIGKSSVIGSNAVVTNKIPSHCVAVGIPAKVVKENITWSRYLNKQDEFSIEDIQNFVENK